MIDPGLLAEARRLINRAQLIAEAPAAQAVEIGRGHPHSQMPPGIKISKPGTVSHIPSTLQQCTTPPTREDAVIDRRPQEARRHSDVVAISAARVWSWPARAGWCSASVDRWAMR